MIRNVFTYAFLFLFATSAVAAGFDIKTSDIIQQPDIKVLGNYKGQWYVVGFEKPGTLNRPASYKILKYGNIREGQSSKLYPSFGEKTIYLQAAIINNKISLFYGRCEKRAEVSAMLEDREAHQEMSQVLRQDYDPNTLEPIGDAKVVFDQEEEFFAASGIEIAESEDKSKTVVLIKCYYRNQSYKVILTDNVAGTELYSKVFSFKKMKEYLSLQNIKVANNGQVLLQTKTRDDVVILYQTSKDKKPAHYYFFSFDKTGAEPKMLDVVSTSGNGYLANPVTGMLNNGQIAIAFNIMASEKATAVKGITVTKYDAQLTAAGKYDVAIDPKFSTMAFAYHNMKKETGLPFLKIQQLLPLEGGNFMLIAEHQRKVTNPEKGKPDLVEHHYLVTYRIDEGMSLKSSHFIPKKQVTTSSVEYAFSARAFRKGNDVYLFHNGDWEADGEHELNFHCTKLLAAGGEPQTQKIVKTSDDFFTSLQNIYPRHDGKILFTEEKLVAYDDISREVKLLEVTLK